MKLKAFVNLLTAGSTVGFPLSCIGVLYWKTDFFKQENGGSKKDSNAQDALMEAQQKAEEQSDASPQKNDLQNSLSAPQTEGDKNDAPQSEPANVDSAPKIDIPLPAIPTGDENSATNSADNSGANSDASGDNSSPESTKTKMTPEKLSKWIQTVINKVFTKRKNLLSKNPKNNAEINKCTSTIATLKQLKKLVETIKVDIEKTTQALATIESET